jgi:uncharacterized membrane protein YhaH (DUF805 family)
MDPKAIYEYFLYTVTKHYFDMSGRVVRSDFWFFVLASFVLGIVAAIVSRITFLPLNAILGLALLLPMAGMGARRLQDTGRNGALVWALLIPAAISNLFGLMMWGPLGIFSFLAFGWLLMLLGLVELVALVALIYFWVQPGDPGENAYGPPPPRDVPVP